jgi:hypothetical protein
MTQNEENVGQESPRLTKIISVSIKALTPLNSKSDTYATEGEGGGGGEEEEVGESIGGTSLIRVGQ